MTRHLPPDHPKPAAVGLRRGSLEALASAVLIAVAHWLGDVDLGSAGPWLPVLILAIRTAEGLLDQRADPTPQRGHLGGGPA